MATKRRNSGAKAGRYVAKVTDVPSRVQMDARTAEVAQVLDPNSIRARAKKDARMLSQLRFAPVE